MCLFSFFMSDLLSDLFSAYYEARKNKRATLNALSFEVEYEKNIMELYQEILDRRYAIRPSVCFVVTHPVKREIFAADFRDRIVHHLIYYYINPLFEKHFIFDSYSCRKGKGTSFGVRRVNHFLRACSNNYQKNCWILKLDIEGYFMSMDRSILWDIIYSVFSRKRNMYFDTDSILYLLHSVIFNDPTKNCIVKGDKKDWIGLPQNKSLFFTQEGKGFPIGNLTSQLFGNVYLDGFDHFVRENLGVRWYGRYVDDMVFVDDRKEFLLEIFPKISHYLSQNLGLKIHPKKIYLQPLFNGVTFLGFRIKPYRIYVGSRIKRNFSICAKRIGEIYKEKNVLNAEEKYKMLSSINSYLGCMYRCKSYSLRKKIIDSLMDSGLQNYFYPDDEILKITKR